MHANLQLKTSNRLEQLLAAWVRRLREEPLPPFAREVVVVQSQGMRRWLTLELARRRGIAAGIFLPFPRELARILTGAVLDGQLDFERQNEGFEAFDRENLRWRLYGLLGEAQDRPGDPLRIPAAYLKGDSNGRKRFQLAARLAALFDDYQLFRGDWLRDFASDRPLFPAGDSRADTAAWQGHLWRRLEQEAGGAAGENLARRLERTLDKLRRFSEPGPLPERITVFGVSSLPPVFLELLEAAAHHLPVEIYFASPTWHYWGDLFSDRELDRLARRFRRRELKEPTLLQGHFDRGNSLLSSLGGQGRDFFNLLQALDDSGEAWQELDFEDPGEDSVLHTLQSDILHLVDRGGPADDRGGAPALPLPDDGSLRIHVCHSPLRELEVLREELLRALVELPGLEPADILVLLPEIESYAPLVDAVFGVAHEGAPFLPYSIADRRLASTQKPAAALLELLELVGKRLTVAEVFALLENPAVRRAAAIAETELPQLRERTEAVGIRWAIDGAQRQQGFGLPAFEEASWQAGIDRLLFGYAIGPTEATCAGIAPAAGDGAGDTDLLGRFLLFLERLFADLRTLGQSRPAAAWSGTLIALVDRQLEAGDEEEELALQLLRDAFARLEEAQALAGLGEELPLEVIRQYLRQVLDDELASGGFLTGGITFCALRPMRSIPFRLVAIAGLDDASFPRRQPPRAFDLLAMAPRPGDRSPRLDDRYLFLETLLAARERLLLFYPGGSQRDNAEKAPSVVLAELLDLLDRSFFLADGRPVRDQLVTRHPLQAFSPANFRGPRPSSSRENAAAAAALAGPREPLPVFLAADFAAPAEPGPTELRLDELIEAYTKPSHFFCRQVLDLRLSGDAEAISATESFASEGLPRYHLLAEMLDRRLDHQELPEDAELELLRARFDLPPAMLGAATYRQLLLETRSLLGRLDPGLGGAKERQPIEISGKDWILRGACELRGGNLLLVRPARLRPRDQLGAFVRGLALQQCRPGSFKNVVFGKSGGFELRPATRPQRAAEILAELVSGYRELLTRPIPFFENASFAFAEQQQRLLDPRQARSAGAELAAARAAYAGDPRRGHRGDQDAATRLLWRGREPLEEPDFARWASRVYRPLLEARREIRK